MRAVRVGDQAHFRARLSGYLHQQGFNSKRGTCFIRIDTDNNACNLPLLRNSTYPVATGTLRYNKISFSRIISVLKPRIWLIIKVRWQREKVALKNKNGYLL